MTLAVYGLTKCSTVKKARDWLDAHGIAYEFHDYRAEPIPREKLRSWCEARGGWEKVVNRASMTWRGLPEEKKENVDTEKALDLMAEKPSLIRRPVVEGPGILLQGFTEKSFTTSFPPAGE